MQEIVTLAQQIKKREHVFCCVVYSDACVGNLGTGGMSLYIGAVF